MKKLFKTFIVEDEEEPLKSLVRELENSPFKTIIKVEAIARSYREALDIILTHKFDLSILDKKLDEGYTCFDLIEKSNLLHYGVIALNSKEQNIPIDKLYLFKELPTYILKPYTESSIKDFIRRLNDIEIKEKLKKISLDAGGDGTISVIEDSIIYVQATGGYIEYFLNEPVAGKNRWLIRDTLLNALKELDNTKFMQVHKKYIANIAAIEKYGPGETRTSGTLYLKGGHTIDYSKDKEEEIQRAMDNL